MMKYKLLRRDYLENIYGRVCKNLEFYEKGDGKDYDNAETRLFELRREKLEVEESLAALTKLEAKNKKKRKKK
jgi:hypothetical protein